MGHKYRWVMLLLGIATILTPISVATAQSVAEIAESITVLIEGKQTNTHGSGFIVARKQGIHSQPHTYYVLTAKHVIEYDDDYFMTTSDSKQYPVNYKQIKPFPQIDLAIVPFTSDQSYNIAKLASSTQLKPGHEVMVAGYPAEGHHTKRQFFSIPGALTTTPSQSAPSGYGLVYNNLTRRGMSGGPVLNSQGLVVGLHGRAESESEKTLPDKAWVNLGIPISLFIQTVPETGLNLSLQLESIAPKPVQPANNPPQRPSEYQNILTPTNSVCIGIPESCQ